MDQTPEENKAAYFTACQKIREAIAGNRIILKWKCYSDLYIVIYLSAAMNAW